MENLESYGVVTLDNTEMNEKDGGVGIALAAVGLGIAGAALMYSIGKDLGEMWAMAESN